MPWDNTTKNPRINLFNEIFKTPKKEMEENTENGKVCHTHGLAEIWKWLYIENIS